MSIEGIIPTPRQAYIATPSGPQPVKPKPDTLDHRQPVSRPIPPPVNLSDIQVITTRPNFFAAVQSETVYAEELWDRKRRSVTPQKNPSKEDT